MSKKDTQSILDEFKNAPTEENVKDIIIINSVNHR